MKKILSLFLVTLMLLSLIACGGSEKTPSSSSEQPEKEPEAEDIGFDGKEFILWQNVDMSEKTDGFTPFFYMDHSTLDDLYQERVKEIEKSRNCTLDFQYYNDSITDKLAGAVSSMNEVVDILLTGSEGVIYPAAAGGQLTPMTEVSDIIDLSNHKKYGSLGELEATMVNSVPYGVCPVGLPGLQNFGLVAVGVYLADHLSTYNLTSPREYLEKGVWNWDTFKKCIVDYTVNEGDRTVKGFNLVNYIFTECALLNNGVEYVVKTEDGYASGLNCEQTLEALEFHKSILNDYTDSIINNKYNWCDEGTPLAAKDVAMAICGSWVLTGVVARDVSNFGLFPFPTGPSGEYGKWNTIIDVTQALTIPVLTDNEEETATIISLMLDPLEGYETEDALADYYNNLFFDEKDSELFFNLGKNSSFSYWNVNGYWFVQYVAQDIKKKSPTELVERYASKIEPTINDYMVPNYEYLNSAK